MSKIVKILKLAFYLRVYRTNINIYKLRNMEKRSDKLEVMIGVTRLVQIRNEEI